MFKKRFSIVGLIVAIVLTGGVLIGTAHILARPIWEIGRLWPKLPGLVVS